MHAVRVEAVRPAPLLPRPSAFAVELTLLFVEQVVFAGDVMHIQPCL